ncbi:MAG: glycosyltransferase family 4 protein [Alphaproteobacteria bacterium]|nr:glycosyltransferase family 4 protein [Alphaproteobacteria bacterium]
MNLLHIAMNDPNAPTGGLGVALHHITRHQAAQHRVVVLCVNEEREQGADYEDGRRIICADLTLLDISGVDMAYHHRAWQALGLALCKRLRHETFDVIHLHDSWLWPVAQQARAMFGCPVVYTHHLSFLSENIGWHGWNRVSSQEARLEAAVIRECYHTFVSHAYARRINTLFAMDKLMPQRPCAVIANGVDSDMINLAPAVDISPLAAGRVPVYFCGRLVESKGIRLVLEAARALPSHHFFLFSRISHDHKDYTPISREMKAASYLLDNISWFHDAAIGSQFGYLKSCSLALVPSLNHAPFEITALEAMAARVPLITTALCGLSDFCHEDNADICAPTAEGLIAAIAGHVRSNERVDRAYATASHYNWLRAAEDYINFYRSLPYARPDLPSRYAA